MTLADRPALCAMLQDAEVMYAYAHAFDDAEADEWIARQLGRYEKYGFGLWAVLLKENGALIGQCGITMQDIGTEEVPEVGYLLRKDCWHRGYATEAAAACRDYAFDILGFERVWSIIRDNNMPSQRSRGVWGCVPADRWSSTITASICRISYFLSAVKNGLYAAGKAVLHKIRQGEGPSPSPC